MQIITTKPAKLKDGFQRMLDGRLFNTETKEFVHPAGRPDLFVQVVEL